MEKILENIELVTIDGQKKYKCGVCGYELCPTIENFRKFALKVERPLSYGQPAMLSPETEIYILREYACPKCATLFEVDMVIKGEAIGESIQLE